MEFRKYDKIHRLGKDETIGILKGTCHIEEKIDGANLSIWLGPEGVLHVGSRNNDLTLNGNAFNGAVEYVEDHPGIWRMLTENPDYRLYGEWLVKHTIAYNATSYKKFYLFDIHTANGFVEPLVVHALAEEYGIDAVPFLATFENPTLEQIQALITKSKFGEFQEGVVIKNTGFVNQFGEFCYAKLVQEAFLEDNGIAFGGNNKYSECYWEQYISNKYVTLERVQKIMNKLQPEVNEKLDMKHIPRIIGTVYHDIIQEEGWEIANKAESVNFPTLKRIVSKKAKQVYCDILTNQISVADM